MLDAGSTDMSMNDDIQSNPKRLDECPKLFPILAVILGEPTSTISTLKHEIGRERLRERGIDYKDGDYVKFYET